MTDVIDRLAVAMNMTGEPGREVRRPGDGARAFRGGQAGG